MTFEPETAFVWIWLPGQSEPVVAGRLDVFGASLVFTYGRRYLARDGAIPIYLPELPLREGQHLPERMGVHGCIADAAPDSWGQRVILNARLGAGAHDTADLGLLTYLLESGSDRIGALDFQVSPDRYTPRTAGSATLEQLQSFAEDVDEGRPVPAALESAVLRGSSIGGARPKALLDDGDRRLIAKFSSRSDSYPVVQGEFMAMRLAQLAGLDVAGVEIADVRDRKALLVERFDRPGGGRRRAMVSAMTILGLTDNDVSFGVASYARLGDEIRARFTDSDATLRELFSRITFNILVSNLDDHARNHAAFWDGEALTLTPAYDVCPSPRSGGEQRQIMRIGSDGWRQSQVLGCVERAATYHLGEAAAREIVDHQIETIETHWDTVADEASLTTVERNTFMGRQFLNPYALEGYRRRPS
jgi:serine/threonine-protein kinase HipA